MLRFLGRDVPVTIYLIILYAILVYGQDLFFGQPVLDIVLGEIRLVSAATLVVTGSWVFVALTFVALFVENVRATKIRGHTVNDYLSIAVEFDNGQDLTYLWSATLPVGTSFRCPFPWWNERETHHVIRSGPAGLGRWQEETQPLLADYERAIGGPPPSRIVAVWLISVAILQRGRGECEYRKIELRGGSGNVFIGP